MKIIKKLFLVALSAGLLSVPSQLEKVEAADPTTKWGVIGNFLDSSWSKDYGFTYDSNDNRFECDITFNQGNEFKLRYNKNWDKQMSYDKNFNGSSNISTYCSDSGGNFKIKEAGEYTLCLDSGVESYSYGYTWALTIVKKVTVKP